MRLFFVTVAIIMFAHQAMAAADCPRCDAYQTAIEQGKQPTSTSLVCFYIEQEGKEAVPLFLHDATGALINADPNNPLLPKEAHRKVKQPTDSYCIGAHYIQDVLAVGGWVDLCNGSWTSARIEGNVLHEIMAAGTSEQSLKATVCLMDGAACDERLAGRQVPQ